MSGRRRPSTTLGLLRLAVGSRADPAFRTSALETAASRLLGYALMAAGFALAIWYLATRAI